MAPVRTQSEVAKGAERSFHNRMTVRNLAWRNYSAVRSQSALVRRVAENRGEHFP